MTSGKEDYLKAIYMLDEGGRMVSNKELSTTLKVSPPSVSEMIVKLEKEGYVKYVAYRGTSLLAKGRREAGRLMRYHALWEVFLVEKLGFSWSEAHEQAELLEHQTSEHLAEALSTYLGHPTRCPHGSVIPKEDGSRENPTKTTLVEIPVGATCIMNHIPEERHLMDYLQSKGITVDMELTVKSKEEYEGPVEVETEKGVVSLSFKAAKQMYVLKKKDA